MPVIRKIGIADGAALSLSMEASSVVTAEIRLKTRMKNGMSYELFQQGPAVYVQLFLFASNHLGILCFPFDFAKVEKHHNEKKYKVLCYCVNFAVMILFVALNGGTSSGGPYILWTWVFSASGVKTLEKRGVLDGYQLSDETRTATYAANDNQTNFNSMISENTATVADTSFSLKEHPSIKFCRKCGFKLIEGSEFCSNCGTKIEKESEV